MLAIDLEAAKKVAIGLIALFVVLSIVSAIVIKNVTTKIITVVVMVGLALGVWTQRQNLLDCADTAHEREAVGATADLTCTFFGTEVTIIGGETS